MTNTQVRKFGIQDAIERDRAAKSAESQSVETTEAEAVNEMDSQPWELWLALGVGLLVIAFAVFM